MQDDSAWYRDPGLLIEELRRSRGSLYRPVPPQIEGYEPLREIRRGGQGIVYRAVQRSTGRTVAVKVLLDGTLASPAALRRFEREIDAVASLRHPYIVGICDSGVTPEGQPYLVMEYVDGPTLDEHVRTNLSRDEGFPRAVLSLFLKICEAMQYAHQNGVIHRDLKPGNIRIDADGEPRVLDFGLAKFQMPPGPGERSVSTVSRTGEFLGSLAWAAPEQVAGTLGFSAGFQTAAPRVDVRTDVYALGVILYQLLTGRLPHESGDAPEHVLQRILHVDPPPPSTLAACVDADLDTIVLTCLAKDPDRRYAGAGALAEDIRRYLSGEPIAARRERTWRIVRTRLRRYRRIALVVSLFSVLCIAFAAVMMVLFHRARQAERLAQERWRLVQTEADKNKAVLAFLDDMLSSVDAERDGYKVTVAQVLDRAVADIDRRFEGRPEIRAALLNMVGHSYLSLGRYEQASRLFAGEVDQLRALAGDRAPRTLRAMHDLASAQFYAGKPEAARRTLRDVLEIGRTVWGTESADYLLARNTLAQILWAEGKLKEAVALAREVLTDQRRRLGADHPDTLSTLRLLGGLLWKAGEPAEAERVLREALARCTRRLGEDHPDTLTALNNLALVLDEQGEWEEAETMFRRFLKAQQRLRGPDHPETLTAMNNLANTLRQRGRFEEAIPLYRQALARSRVVLGDENAFTLQLLHNLARTLHDGGDPDQALPLLKEAYTALARLRGETHPDTMTALGSYAGALADVGRLEEAEAMFARLLGQQRQTLGPRHPSTLMTWNNLAGVRRDRGRYAEALQAYEGIVPAAEEVFGAKHWFPALCRSSAGWCLFKLGRRDEAERSLRKACDALKRSLGDEHRYTKLALERLATVRGKAATPP